VSLHYLLFDASEGGDGTGAFEAMAAVLPAQAAAVEAEIAEVLAWAQATFAARAAPEDGGDWDADVQVHAEPDGGGLLRQVFTVSIAGSAAFCAAFAAQFGEAIG